MLYKFNTPYDKGYVTLLCNIVNITDQFNTNSTRVVGEVPK